MNRRPPLIATLASHTVPTLCMPVRMLNVEQVRALLQGSKLVCTKS